MHRPNDKATLPSHPGGTAARLLVPLRVAVARLCALLLFLPSLALAAPFAYISNSFDDTVSVIDTATDTVAATVAVGSGPVGAAVNPAGTRVYVANYTSNNVSVIDTATNTVTATVGTGGINPIATAVSIDGTRVYVTNRGSNNVSVIDAATNTVTATVAVGSEPKGVAVNPAGTRVYVANYTSNNVSVIDTATNTVAATVAVGSAPQGVAVNPAGTRVYVTNSSGNDVSVIDTATNTVTATVAVGFDSNGVAVNSAGTRVYVTNYASWNVSVIDAATNTVTATVAVGTEITGVALIPDGTRAYVPNTINDTVSVIDTATNTVLGTVAVGFAPQGHGQFIVGVAADITPDAFSFTAQTGAALSTLATSDTITVSGINTAAVAISITGGEYRIGSGGWNSAAGVVNSGDTVTVRQTSSASYSTLTAATLTIGTASAAFDVTTGAAAPVNGACGGDHGLTLTTTPTNLCATGAPSAVASGATSYTWSCAGSNGGSDASCSATRNYVVTASVSGGNGTISASQTVAYNATPSFTLTPNAGYLSGPVSGTCGGALAGNSYTTSPVTASCTVVAGFSTVDTTPDPFSFTAQTGAALSSVATSNTITVSGINSAAATSITGGTYSINGGAYTSAAGTVSNGQTVTVRQTSSGSYSTLSTATLTIGGVSGAFDVTTQAVPVDTTPDPFSFTAQTGAALSSVATSNTITVSGINSAAATSIVGGSYSINGGAYTTAAGTVNNGQTVTVRQTSSASYSTLTAATLTIGGVNGAFNVTTQAAPAVITSYTAPSATGTGNITASFTGGGAGCGYTVNQYIPLTGHAASPPAGSAPAGVSFPHGLFDFITGGCTAGSTIIMTITYPQALPTGTAYWKYGPTPGNATPHWYQLPATIAGNTATFSITDGGLGDDDLTANGIIVDQGGSGVPGAGGAASIPTLSEWALLALAGLMGLFGMRAMRRRAVC